MTKEGPLRASVRNGGAASRIAAIEYAFPDQVVTNEQLAAAHPSWKVAHAAPRTGVLERRWCRADETALDLAVTACGQLAARDQAFIGGTDAILFCTQSPDHWMPPNACLLQDRLGLSRSVAALDFPLACSGYVYGLYLANALVASGSARQVLLIMAETYSKWMHPGDRGPVLLFGDAAAASVVTSGPGIGPIALGTDGSGAATFCVPAGAARTPRSMQTAMESTDSSGNVRTPEHVLMDGPAVLDFVKREIPQFVRQYLAQVRTSVDGVDLVIFHQASRIGLDYLNEALQVPREKQFMNLELMGNTVSASLPIALQQAAESGRLRRGMKALLVGFGVGLSWGASIVTWNPDE